MPRGSSTTARRCVSSRTSTECSPADVSVWRDERDGRLGQTGEAQAVRDLFQIGRMTTKTIEILTESLPLMHVFEAVAPIKFEIP